MDLTWWENNSAVVWLADFHFLFPVSRRDSTLSLISLSSRAVRRGALVLAGAVIVAGSAMVAADTAVADRSDNAGPEPRTITLHVSLGDSGPAGETLKAVVFEPTAQRVRGIQVMIPGATYDRRYFDLEVGRGRVSQAIAAARDGWISVAVDRLGTGESSRPAADKLGNRAHAATIHQLVTTLKAIYKDVPVTLVGHSLGSVIAIEEAATYKDVDAVVVTGFMHHSGVAQALFNTMVRPAAGDPRFENRPAPKDYLTTQDGLRHLFYWPFNADLGTVEADEVIKQTTTMPEITDFLNEQNNQVYSRKVTVPVLTVVGEHDYFWFEPTTRGKAIAEEPGAYPGSPRADVKVVPDAGHNLALQRNADSTTRTIDQWLIQTFSPR